MKPYTICLSDEVSGITVFSDGTKAYWSEGRGGDTDVVYPDGRKEQISNDSGHPILSEIDQITQNGRGRVATPEEESEHESIRNGGIGGGQPPFPSGPGAGITLPESKIKYSLHETNIMNKYRTELLDLLLSENEAMDTADGKGVAKAAVKSSSAPAGGEKETKVKLSGGGDNVGGKLPTTPPSGKVPGGEDGIKSPEGKGIAKTGGKSETSSGGKGEKMKPEGDSIADTSVKPTKDLPKNPNLAKENKKSFVLPHDVMVEHDGKVTQLKAGTTVTLVSESEKKKDCDDHKDPACSDTEKGLKKADKGNKKAHMKESIVKEEEDKPFGGKSEEKEEGEAEEKEEGEGEGEEEGEAEEKEEGEEGEEGDDKPFGGKSEAPVPPSAEGDASNSDFPEMADSTALSDAGTDMSIIDRLAMSVDDFAATFKEFLGVEKGEEEHQEGDLPMEDEAAESEIFGGVSDLPSDTGTDENVVNDNDLPEVGQSPNPFAR